MCLRYLYSEMSVKVAPKTHEKTIYHQILRFIKPLPPTVQEQLRLDMNNDDYQVFLLLCGDETIVALASCATLEEIKWIKELFYLEDEFYEVMIFCEEDNDNSYVRSHMENPEFHCHLRHLYIAAGFNHLLPLFIREIARQSGYLNFYMKVTENSLPCNCLREFNFAKPKPVNVLPHENERPGFDLYYLNIKQNNIEKVDNSSKIVVIGNDSELMLAFVENLIFRYGSIICTVVV